MTEVIIPNKTAHIARDAFNEQVKIKAPENQRGSSLLEQLLQQNSAAHENSNVAIDDSAWGTAVRKVERWIKNSCDAASPTWQKGQLSVCETEWPADMLCLLTVLLKTDLSY